MLREALLTLLTAGAVLGPAAAQNTLYPGGDCRITGRGAEFGVNVTCTCGQQLRQTADSIPIDSLEIIGCLIDDPVNQDDVQLTFLPPGLGAERRDFVLLNVRSVNVSQTRLRLVPVRGGPGAGEHPLRRLHIGVSELTGGLPDGALQGLSNLEHFSLDHLITAGRAIRSALADLPQLQELFITNTYFQFFNPGVVVRTPRLHRMRFTNSRFDYMGSGAIVVNNDGSDMADSGSCPPADDSFLEFNNMAVTTMSRNAISVRSVARLLVSNNSIVEMYSGALNVSLRAPADCRPQLRLVLNTLSDVRSEAVTVENMARQPAVLELGGNTLFNTALSPLELRLLGAFERRPVAGLGPSQFDCSCCGCPGPRRLIEVALQSQPSQFDTDTFVTLLASARCAGDGDSWFLDFASGCVPDAGLIERVASLVPLPDDRPSPSAARRPAAGPLTPLLLLLTLLAPLAQAAADRD